MELLCIKDLQITYPTRKGPLNAVDGVSLELSENHTLGLIGESGCGKSSMVFAFMGFVTPPGRISRGSIFYKGQDIVQLTEEQRRGLRGKELAIVLQGAQNALNPVMKIGKQISEQVLVHEDLTKNEAWERARNQLELVGISPDRVDSYPHEFSGGMRQRVMIAIATACSPKLLILDEPVTGLDVIVQRQLLNLINDLRQKIRVSIIFITHDLSVVTETCDRVAVMYAGKIVEKADMVKLYQKPKHPYTQALISSYPSIIGEKKVLKAIPGAPPNLLTPPEGCRFHPRCSHAMDICRKEEPLLKTINDHSVACHLIK